MNTSNPKISIITPSFNQGEFIEETILSVIGQGYPNLEYIIIDGGSTDETINIIKKYEANINYWVSEKDKGQSHAINKGFSKATGDIVGWLNSDDMYMPNCLTTVSKLLDKNDTSLLYGNCIHFKESKETFVSWGSDVVSFSKKVTLENFDFISQPSCFWTIKAWNMVGALDENIHYAFDWEWFLRAKNLGINFYNTSKCLSLYRIHDNHKSGTGGKVRQQELLSVYRKYSKKYAFLYEMVMSETFDKERFKSKLIRKAFNFINKPLDNINSLRVNSINSYKGYTDSEIEFCIKML